MKKIGIIDFYIDEWHSNTYLGLFKRANEILGLDYKISYGWAELDRFDGRRSTDEWCSQNGIERCLSIEELCEKSDNILILAPANPEKHIEYAKVALKYGKATYIDKTFAENANVARQIYQIADAYGTKIFSTSALRYADEISSLGEVKSLLVKGGGRSLEEYIVHQIEMAVKVMGADAKEVYLFDREEHSTAIIDFGGRYATLDYSRAGAFAVDVCFADLTCKYLPISNDGYFYRLIEDILKFFESGIPPFDAAETIAVIAIRDAIIKAKTLSLGVSVKIEV